MTLPMTAMPSAPPTSRDRSLTAEATPCWPPGRAEVIALVAGVMAQPMPTPRMRIPLTSSQYGLVRSTWAMMASAAAMSSRPVTHIRRAPYRAARAGANRAVGIMVAAMGSMLTAAIRAE